MYMEKEKGDGRGKQRGRYRKKRPLYSVRSVHCSQKHISYVDELAKVKSESSAHHRT